LLRPKLASCSPSNLLLWALWTPSEHVPLQQRRGKRTLICWCLCSVCRCSIPSRCAGTGFPFFLALPPSRLIQFMVCRMAVPARGASCLHVGAFDLRTFLLYNLEREEQAKAAGAGSDEDGEELQSSRARANARKKKKRKSDVVWECPLCSKQCPPSKLRVCGTPSSVSKPRLPFSLPLF
jgi:hypothetical protein